jgi:NhaP-type Na+/H+ or K+/H+ antiporter
LSTLAELTLALVLFTDAANANLKELKLTFHIPQRLLLIGLPLTILLGFGTGLLLFGGLTLLEAAILATMLAPTDAALGKAVVTDEAVPEDIREGLNVESGLNDGICVPILFIFLALAAPASPEGGTSALALRLVVQAIGVGVAVGAGLTLLGMWLLELCEDRGWVTETWRQLPVPALAVVCFAVAQWLGGSGFIACFVGGMLFGGIEKGRKHKLLLAAEGTGDTLALITWVVFGAAVVGRSIGSLSWEVVVYALLSLTLVRMLPVFLVLGGMKLRTDEKLFMGWFGPRGLASIVFAVIVLNKHLPGGGTISMTVVCTIVLSIIAHGLSANPLVAALAERIKRSEGEKGP